MLSTNKSILFGFRTFPSKDVWRYPCGPWRSRPLRVYGHGLPGGGRVRPHGRRHQRSGRRRGHPEMPDGYRRGYRKDH